MKRYIIGLWSSLLVTAMILSLAPVSAYAATTFSDVSKSSPYYDGITWAVSKGITNGTGNGKFSPDTTCNVAQILTFIYRANNSPATTGTCPFTEVPASSPYYKALCWAAEKKLYNGSESSSITPCTRAMAVTYIWKAAGSPAPERHASFNDVDPRAWYAKAVTWASVTAVTAGTSAKTFSPDNTCTRGQIVTFLYRSITHPIAISILGNPVWPQSELYDYCGYTGQPVKINTSDTEYNTFIEVLNRCGKDGKSLYEQYSSMGVAKSFYEITCDSVGSRAKTNDIIREIKGKPNLVISEANPKPMTALLIDTSEEIVQNDELISVDKASSDFISDRLFPVGHVITQLSGGKIVFTDDPAEADLFIEVFVDHPYYNDYYSGAYKASVYSCRCAGVVTQRTSTNKTWFDAVNDPPGSFTLSKPLSKYWRSLDANTLSSSDSVKTCVNTILGWYGENAG